MMASKEDRAHNGFRSNPGSAGASAKDGLKEGSGG
jgi:hypothetical protein